MKLWIARDKSDGLRLFKDKPVYNGFCWRGECIGDLDYRIFSEVTFENSPMEIELNIVNMELWIGRDNPIIPEDMEHYIERHPEDEIRYAKLHIFYDKPIWKDGRWCCAREMCEVKNYMFPEIKSGECVEFKSI